MAGSLKIAANTTGIIFLATPHSGADIAGWASCIGSSLTGELTPGSAYLDELKKWFSSYARDRGLFVSAYYETQRYKQMTIVHKESADPNCYGCTVIGLDADHTTIAKPLSPSSDIFIRIKRDVLAAKRSLETMSSAIARIEDILLFPALTNPMYFDVLRFLNEYCSSFSRKAIIISNPFGGPRPCCVIVTKDEELIREISPLQKRFPDRFAIQTGILGEFTSELRERTQGIPSHLRTFVKAITRLLTRGIRIKAALAFQIEERIFVLSATHIIDSLITDSASLILKTILDPNRRFRKRTTAIEYFQSLSAIEKEDCIDLIKNDFYSRNNFKISLFNFKTKTYDFSVSCELSVVDFTSDAALFSFHTSGNSQAAAWCKANLYFTEAIPPLRSLWVGERCTTPEEPNADLRIESIDETVVFPIQGKMTALQNIIIIGGEPSAKMGSSGAPVLDTEGRIIGMIIGRSNQGGKYKYLAVDIAQVFQKLSKQLPKIERKSLAPPP
jgi:hypothetical protein